MAPGSGGIFRAPDKGIFLGRLDVGNRGTRSGIPVSSKSEQEVVLLELTRNQQQQERQKQREQQTAADSCGELRKVATGDPPSTGSADLGCTITFAGRHFVPILPFGNSFAESPFRVSSCHWQLERVSSKRMVAVR